MTLFVGRDIPGTKVKGVTDSGGGAVVKLETRFIRIGARVLPFHVGLVQQLPEVWAASNSLRGRKSLYWVFAGNLLQKPLRPIGSADTLVLH